tara:strand:+ start:41 stop:301 length:261 start_codon:yes stop_codon:yes gene_type:complete
MSLEQYKDRIEELSDILQIQMQALQVEVAKVLKLKGIILSVTSNSKEVLTNSKNTIAVRKGFEMSGSVKHYIVSRADFNYLKEQVK